MSFSTGVLQNRLTNEELIDFNENIRISSLPIGVKNTLVAGLKSNLKNARGRVFEATRAFVTNSPGLPLLHYTLSQLIFSDRYMIPFFKMFM